jgi:acyl-CoA thioester hydrolase
MKFRNYRHVIPVQIRFSDIDRLKHVNNACYHNYIELGRVSYFDAVFQTSINWDNEGFILARTEMDHIEPLYLHDDIYCFTRVEKIGQKSIRMQNAIVKKTTAGMVEAAVATGVLVAMDYITGKSIPVPQMWRQRIEEFER